MPIMLRSSWKRKELYIQVIINQQATFISAIIVYYVFMATATTSNPAFKNLDMIAKLMDAQFKIPGTNIKFGLDPLIGLIPGAGDFAGFIISGFMLIVSAKNGASGFLLARMSINIILDALIGSIPVIGDIFDVAFKANQLNMKLMHEHYQEGRHNGSAWKLIIPVLIMLFLFIAAMGWISYKIFSWLIKIL